VTDLVLAPSAPLKESASEEAELIRRLAASEPAAVGEAYDAHHAAVRAFAQRFIGDPAAA
jgi:RNA polymerase sigma-70 factor, ECF subfamily